MNAAAADELLSELERRVLACETAIGGGIYDTWLEDDQDSIGVSDFSIAEPTSGEKGANEVASKSVSSDLPGDVKSNKLRENATRSTSDSVEEESVGAQLSRLAHKASMLIRGPLAEFENSYNDIKVYMEPEHAELSSIVLNLQAKRTFILQNQSFLRETVEQLKEFEQLQQFANHPDMSELENYQRRLQKLDDVAREMSEKSLNLTKQIQELAQNYNTAMNMLSVLLMQWDEILTKREKRRTEAS